MIGNRRYPDAVAGPFPEPPVEFDDGDGRPIEIRAAAEGDDVFEALVAMYDDFDPADRAQGLPPLREDRVRGWLETLLDGEALNVVAWHDEQAAGHATLVPDGSGASELAIFVHQDYQGAGVGSNLIAGLLGYGAANGVEKVWLTVERWNRPAVALYEKVGFETAEAESFELEMTLRLAESDDENEE
ncbi:GNAT family N-acetyltransferase [Halocalculus aciditolerans]|uniref:GNAT family N-acetyltransferase n=1 Tax=Halocalculus aciditolerans TaxID=1383812 RepID=A0A830FQ72_9EURY|nr:GNAT family N-acetyltransferase [Halocalculus aciditolerans]GGL69643.1 GNAT family N-acetyltransferase [Halocalculus aciditolerans]